MRRRLGWAAFAALLLHLALVFWGPFPAWLAVDVPASMIQVWLPPSGQQADSPAPLSSPSSAQPAVPMVPESVTPVRMSPVAQPAAQQALSASGGAGAGRAAEVIHSSTNSGQAQERAVVRPPQCRRDPTPDLPTLSRALGEVGQVRLRLRVEADGRLSVTVLQSSGFSRLDEAARAAATRWRCRPAERAGQPLAAEIDETVIFQLD